MFLRDGEIIYNNFVQTISDNRKIPLDQVKSIADGSTVLGEKAKELGLVDEIGGLPDALNYLEKTTNTTADVCWE